jgi:hypothetical protein
MMASLYVDPQEELRRHDALPLISVAPSAYPRHEATSDRLHALSAVLAQVVRAGKVKSPAGSSWTPAGPMHHQPSPTRDGKGKRYHGGDEEGRTVGSTGQIAQLNALPPLTALSARGAHLALFPHLPAHWNAVHIGPPSWGRTCRVVGGRPGPLGLGRGRQGGMLEQHPSFRRLQ